MVVVVAAAAVVVMVMVVVVVVVVGVVVGVVVVLLLRRRLLLGVRRHPPTSYSLVRECCDWCACSGLRPSTRLFWFEKIVGVQGAPQSSSAGV